MGAVAKSGRRRGPTRVPVRNVCTRARAQVTSHHRAVEALQREMAALQQMVASKQVGQAGNREAYL